jgi:hypothetical protein
MMTYYQESFLKIGKGKPPMKKYLLATVVLALPTLGGGVAMAVYPCMNGYHPVYTGMQNTKNGAAFYCAADGGNAYPNPNGSGYNPNGGSYPRNGSGTNPGSGGIPR